MIMTKQKTTVATFQQAVDAIAVLIMEDLQDEGWESLESAEFSRYIDDTKEYVEELLECYVDGAFLDEEDRKTIIIPDDGEWGGFYTYRKFIMAVRKKLKSMEFVDSRYEAEDEDED